MRPWTDAIYDFPDDQDASLMALLSSLRAHARSGFRVIDQAVALRRGSFLEFDETRVDPALSKGVVVHALRLNRHCLVSRVRQDEYA